MGVTQRLGTIPLAIQTDSSNNVGIGGAANASYKLAVTGAGLFTGALTASTTFTLDGTKKVFLRSNQSTGGGLLSGSAIGAMGNFSIYSDDGVAGDILGMYYWNGGTYRSALQFANVSSGSSNLLLMKDGGNVCIGTSTSSGYGNVNLDLNAGASNAAYFVIRTGNNSTIAEFALDGGSAYLSTKTSHPLRIRTADTTRIEVSSAGRTQFTHSTNDLDIIYAVNGSASPYGMNITFSGAAPNNTTNNFLYFADYSAVRFKVTSNGNAYNQTGTYTSGVSDIRYKEQIVDAKSQWNDIKNLRVVNFKFIKDVEENGENALRQIGFIAQEVEQVSPNLIDEMTDYQTGETWKTIKTSIIHTKAIKALQEAMARIEELEAKVTALENK